MLQVNRRKAKGNVLNAFIVTNKNARKMLIKVWNQRLWHSPHPLIPPMESIENGIAKLLIKDKICAQKGQPLQSLLTFLQKFKNFDQSICKWGVHRHYSENFIVILEFIWPSNLIILMFTLNLFFPVWLAIVQPFTCFTLVSAVRNK